MWLAYRGMYRSEGLSPLILAGRFFSNPPSVIHAHYGPPAAQLCRFAQVLRRPLVASFYGYDASMTRYREERVWQRRYARLFSYASAFVVEGPAMGARLEALGCPAEKIHVARLPADASSLQAITRKPASTFTVAMAGRFTEKKGFDTGIAAFARAFRDDRDTNLLLIGGGELESDYSGQIAALGISDRVIWAGRLPFSEFMTRLGSAHVALYPSRTAQDGDAEGGAPVTLIEAQWLGVPSIVSTHDDLPFVAAPNGAVVLDRNDVDVWADALRSVFEDPTMLQSMSQEASAYTRLHHSPKTNAITREAVYASVC